MKAKTLLNIILSVILITVAGIIIVIGIAFDYPVLHIIYTGFGAAVVIFIALMTIAGYGYWNREEKSRLVRASRAHAMELITSYEKKFWSDDRPSAKKDMCRLLKSYGKWHEMEYRKGMNGFHDLYPLLETKLDEIVERYNGEDKESYIRNCE